MAKKLHIVTRPYSLPLGTESIVWRFGLLDQGVSNCVLWIASSKVPRVVRLRNEWPRSATKIQKSVLREQFLTKPA